MLEALFESKIKENILLYLFINELSYPSELAKNFDLNLYAVQNHFISMVNNLSYLPIHLQNSTRKVEEYPR